MYREHVPIIAAGMRLRPEIMTRGIMFAVLSARQPFYRVPDQLAELERDGEAAAGLFSWKYDAWRYIQANEHELYHRLRLARTTRDALFEVTRIPGIGLVKGAFVLQLLGHDIACFDSQNMNREIGGHTREWDTRGQGSSNLLRKSGPAFHRLMDRYLAKFGGHGELYWNAWCNDVGPKYGMSGEDCSRVHLCIVPPATRKRVTPFGLDTIPLREYIGPDAEIPF